MNNLKLGWVAGFLEGEGSFMTNKKDIAIISASSTDKDSLEKLQSICGGNIYKVTKRRDHWKQAWKWALKIQTDVVELCKSLKPHMSHRKTEEINKLLNVRDLVKKRKEDKSYNIKKRHIKILEDYATGRYSTTEVSEIHDIDRSYVSILINKYSNTAVGKECKKVASSNLKK